jgi:hypothetical protein
LISIPSIKKVARWLTWEENEVKNE